MKAMERPLVIRISSIAVDLSTTTLIGYELMNPTLFIEERPRGMMINADATKHPLNTW